VKISQNFVAFSEYMNFTTSKTDHHLLPQKVCQRITVMKANTGGFCCLQDKM
jgi:hypothetical protein